MAAEEPAGEGAVIISLAPPPPDEVKSSLHIGEDGLYISLSSRLRNLYGHHGNRYCHSNSGSHGNSQSQW